MKYETLTDERKADLLDGRIRGLEEEHYLVTKERENASEETRKVNGAHWDGRLAELEATVEVLREERDALRGKAAD